MRIFRHTPIALGFGSSTVIRFAGSVSYLCCRWCVEDLAGVCARQPIQRLGRDPTGAYSGDQRHLWSYPSPQLPCLVINSLGWSLAFRSAVGVFLTVSLIPSLLARIDAEENLLYSQFGDEYDTYRSHTRRLIPGIY